jgi:hypothetical protein
LYNVGVWGQNSTMFLLGPARQLRTMCDPDRRIACTIYFCSLFFTLFSALKVHTPIS